MTGYLMLGHVRKG